MAFQPPARLLAALLVLVALVPAGQAAVYSFGSIVGKTDYDYTTYPGAKKLGLCFIDRDGGVPGAYNSGEPLYLDNTNACAAGVQVDFDDIRLASALPQYGPGSMVVAADEDYLVRMYSGAVPHFLRYYDANLDGKYKAPETLYVDLFGPGGISVGVSPLKEANVGDLRLTAFGTLGAATFVGPTDPDFNFGLTDIKAGGVGFGSTDVVYKAASAYYVNTDVGPLPAAAAPADFTKWDPIVEEHDVRINAKAENPFGDFGAATFTYTPEVASDPVVAGRPFQLKVAVKNTGKMAASAPVETFVEDVLVDARGTATIAPGASGAVVMTLIAPAEAGTHSIRVGKDNFAFVNVDPAPVQSAAQVAVAQAPAAPAAVAEPVEPGDDAGSNPVPAPSLVLGAAIIGLAALLGRRRFA